MVTTGYWADVARPGGGVGEDKDGGVGFGEPLTGLIG